MKPTRIRHWALPLVRLLVVVATVSTNGIVRAQPETPKRPVSGITDEAEILSVSEEEALSRRMTGFSEDYGIQVYLYTTRFVTEIDEQEMASLVLDAWRSGEGPAILALFEQLTNSMNYAFNPAASEKVGAGVLRAVLRDSVLYSSRVATDDLDYQTRVVTAIARVMDQLATQLPRTRRSPGWYSQNSPIFLFFAGGLLVAALAVGALYIVNRRSPSTAVGTSAEFEGIGPEDPPKEFSSESPEPVFRVAQQESSGEPQVRPSRRRRLAHLKATRRPKSRLPHRRND